jgi:hypothetical protein
MSVELRNRLNSMSRMAFSLCIEIENDLYKILLGEKHYNPASVLEVMLLGITHLNLSIIKRKGENLYQDYFNAALKQYAKDFLQKNSLSSSVDFELLFSTRLEENMITLDELVYNNDATLAYDECNRFYYNPLNVPLPAAVIHPTLAREITPILKEFIEQLEEQVEHLLSQLEDFNWEQW